MSYKIGQLHYTTVNKENSLSLSKQAPKRTSFCRTKPNTANDIFMCRQTLSSYKCSPIFRRYQTAATSRYSTTSRHQAPHRHHMLLHHDKPPLGTTQKPHVIALRQAATWQKKLLSKHITAQRHVAKRLSSSCFAKHYVS
jgi:hypothetical protein